MTVCRILERLNCCGGDTSCCAVAHCWHRCISFLWPWIIFVRWIVSGLEQKSHFTTGPPSVRLAPHSRGLGFIVRAGQIGEGVLDRPGPLAPESSYPGVNPPPGTECGRGFAPPPRSSR